MKNCLFHLWLGILLIAAASALLLFSDLDRRVKKTDQIESRQAIVASKDTGHKEHCKIALSYFAPQEAVDKLLRGIREGLEAHGYVEGENCTLTEGHCNGEISMLPQVTQSLANSNCDIFAALSTPSLANAVALVKDVPIVFGFVSAPLQAKAGKTYEDHLPNVTGAVFMNPTEDTIRWSRKFFPQAIRFGTIYNPSEANSVKEIGDLKQHFKKYGFELIAAPINNTSEISQAMQSVFQQQPDLFFIMADNTVGNAIPPIVKMCQEQGVPVIADDGGMMGDGAFLTCGPSPYIEGIHTAEMIVRVLEGEKPENMPFEPSVDHPLVIDFKVAKSLNLDITEEAKNELKFAFNFSDYLGRPAKIAVVNLVSAITLDAGAKGVELELQDCGLVPGKDYIIKNYNAQGDISLLPQIYDTAIQGNPDVIVSVSSPALVAGVNKVKDIPYAFTIASEPEKLGLFKNGKPENITGVYAKSTTAKLVEMAMEHDAELNKVGIIYDPSQPQSLFEVEVLRKAGKQNKIEVLEATASSVSDLTMATQSLIQRGSKAFILSADNLVSTGFASIQKVAFAADVPVFVSDMDLISLGATGGIGPDYTEWGKQTGRQVFKILTGLSPAKINIESTNVAKVVKPCKKQHTAKSKQPFELRLVMYNETQFAEDCAAGLMEGLAKAGLKDGVDFNIRVMNAQGDMSTLSSIMTSVKSDQVDLLMVVTTPCLQAALRQAGKDTRIVFTGVGDGVKAGAGKSESEHLPNVTGITTRSPFRKMAKLLNETMPGVKKVGTLYTPAEINSELYRRWLEEALAEYDIELVGVPVTASSETAQAAISLCQENIQAITQIVDNTTRPGFAHIARKAADNNLPVYVFDSKQMQDGASLCIARDYFDAGLEAAEKAIRVLNGELPGKIPFSNTKSERLILNSKLANKYKLTISDELKKKAEMFQDDKI